MKATPCSSSSVKCFRSLTERVSVSLAIDKVNLGENQDVGGSNKETAAAAAEVTRQACSHKRVWDRKGQWVSLLLSTEPKTQSSELSQ